MNTSEGMGTRPVGKLLAEFSIPAIGSLLVSSLYTLVDRIFIGQGTGVGGMAAVTAAWPIMICSFTIGVMFQTGGRTLAAVALGSGDVDKAERYLSKAVSAAFILGTIFSILLWLVSRPALRLFGASGASMPQAEAYVDWILVSSPGQAVAMTLVAALSAEGRPKACFLLQLAGTLVNAALAPVFIFALGWGVAGAGLAVALSQGAGLILTIVIVLGKKSSFRPRARHLFPSPAPIADLVRVGVPMALMQLVTCSAFAVANIAVKPYGGELGLAAIGVVVTVVQFLGFPLFGIVNGAQTLWGYNYGACKWRRIARISFLTLAWGMAFALLSEFAMVAAPGFFVRLFSSDQSLAGIGAHSMRLFALTFAVLPIELGPAFYFQSTGRSGPASVVLVLRTLSFAAGMFILPLFLGYDGVLWAEPLSDAITGLLGIFYLWRMVSEIRTLVAAERAETACAG